MLKGIEKSITDLPPETIAAEIERTAAHAKVDDVYVMQKYLIKVRFNSLNNANLITERGLKMFALSVTQSQIETERFTAINQCRPKQSHKIFPCRETGHIRTECNNEFKKCLRCVGNHHTLANSCPERKK